MSDRQNSKDVFITVNGTKVCVDPKTHTNLLAFLRNELQLTGSKHGCATGNCGSCTVIIDGLAMQSCQASLASVDQSTVETIENIVHSSLGKRITDALTKHDAAQCGYCLPGIVVAACAEVLTAETPDPVHALQRNLCRCGTNSRILNALKDVMDTDNGGTG